MRTSAIIRARPCVNSAISVLEAANARAALQMLEAHPEIAVLFTDVGLPGGMNGRQLAEEARKLRPDISRSCSRPAMPATRSCMTAGSIPASSC